MIRNGSQTTARQDAGLEGALNGIRSFGHLLNLLRQHFAPASTQSPPGAKFIQAKGRRIPIAQKQRLTDSVVLALTPNVATPSGPSAQLTWQFSTQFPKPPVVTFSVEGAPQNLAQPPQLFISTGNRSSNAVTVFSTDPGDARQIHLTAVYEDDNG